MKKIILVLALLQLVFAGSFSAVHLTSQSRLEIDSTLDKKVNSVMRAEMQKYHDGMQRIVGREIGKSAQYMESRAPESLLSNFLSDQLLVKAKEVCGNADLAVLNLGGIRAPLPKGKLTVADIYRIMPFENELVVLDMKGSDLIDIMNHIASEGGEGVSNVRMEIADRKIQSLLIDGKSLDPDKIYRVATMDYLADGNSGMTAFLKNVKRINTHLKVRDVYISRIEQLSREGKAAKSSLDERIRIKK